MNKLVLTSLLSVFVAGCAQTQQGPTQEDFAKAKGYEAVLNRCLAAFPKVERTAQNNYGADINSLPFRDQVTLGYCSDYANGHVATYDLKGFCMPKDFTVVEADQQLVQFYKSNSLKVFKDELKTRLQSYKVMTEIYPCTTSL